VNPSLTLIGQIKARACDWAIEEKGGVESFGEGEREEDRKKRWKEDGAETCGLEEPKVKRDLIVGE